MADNLKKALLVAVFAIPFTPLVLIQEFAYPFVTGRNFFFRIIVLLALGIWIILASRDERYRPKFSSVLFAIAAFVLVMGLANLFGANPYASFMGNFNRMEGWITLVHLLIFFLIASSSLSTERLWDRFFKTSIGVSVVLCSISLLQIAGLMNISTDTGRVDSVLGNAAFLGAYLLLHIFISLLILIREHRAGARWLLAGVILLQTVILFFTATRSAMLGLIGGLFVTAILLAVLERKRKIVRNISLSVILAVFLIIGTFVAVRDHPIVRDNRILNRFNDISFQGMKEQARYRLWQIAILGFKDNPILGQGQENFNIIYNRYYDPALFNDEEKFDRAHNVFFEWLVAGGVIGLVAYLSIHTAVILSLWRSDRSVWPVSEKILFSGFIAAYLLNGFFMFDDINTYILLFSVLAYVHYRSVTAGRVREEPRNFRIPIAPTLFICAAVIVLAWIINGRAVIASIHAINGMESLSGRPEESLKSFKKSLEQASFGSVSISEALAIRLIEEDASKNLNRDMIGRFSQVILAELETEMRRSPGDAHNYYLAGSVLALGGNYDQSEELLQKAYGLAPRKQAVLLKLWEVYMAKKDFKRAYAVAEAAYGLDRRYPVARMARAVSLMYTDMPVSDPSFVEAFELLLERSMKIPGDNQTRLALAGGYYKLGRLEEALRAIEEAIKYDSSLKEPGEDWVRRIRSEIKPKR